MGSKDDSKRAAYDFLLRHAGKKTSFTFKDIATATKSWKKVSTWTTYVSKQLRDYVERDGDKYSVRGTFSGLTFEQYRALSTQVRFPVSQWNRRTYDHLVSYEFLLPLTREDKLRAALENLFYREALDQRTSEFTDAEIGELKKVLPPAQGETDEAYRGRVVAALAQLIGGYSISHVSGRFRVPDNVVSRSEAADMLVKHEPYLIDETTAVVRFIVRCPNSKCEHGTRFDHEKKGRKTRVEDDIRFIRTLFFLFFVEAVARTIQGEEVIWLLENSPKGERLYAWEKMAHGAQYVEDQKEADDEDDEGEGSDRESANEEQTDDGENEAST